MIREILYFGLRFTLFIVATIIWMAVLDRGIEPQRLLDEATDPLENFTDFLPSQK